MCVNGCPPVHDLTDTGNQTNLLKQKQTRLLVPNCVFNHYGSLRHVDVDALESRDKVLQRALAADVGVRRHTCVLRVRRMLRTLQAFMCGKAAS